MLSHVVIRVSRRRYRARAPRGFKEKEEFEYAFELCVASRDEDGQCECGEDCAMLKMIRCPTCKEIKKGKCRVAACKEAAPLLLTDESGGAPALLTFNP
mmetsp:Transcript_46587/g.122304  ORF Transcript_46587/g.122304 Transcript_46587/m.122304 type:complete len:99 (+) Transcript_46587:2973-3269(+)